MRTQTKKTYLNTGVTVAPFLMNTLKEFQNRSKKNITFQPRNFGCGKCFSSVTPMERAESEG